MPAIDYEVKCYIHGTPLTWAMKTDRRAPMYIHPCELCIEAAKYEAAAAARAEADTLFDQLETLATVLTFSMEQHPAEWELFLSTLPGATVPRNG